MEHLTQHRGHPATGEASPEDERDRKPGHPEGGRQTESDPAASTEAESHHEMLRDVEPGDVEALMRKAGELHGMSGTIRGLESVIVGAGFEALARQYGGARLLEAMQAHGVSSLTDVFEQLEPSRSRRKELYAFVEDIPMEPIANRLNTVNGGLSYDRGHTVGALERSRQFLMDDIRRGNPTDEAGELLSAGFDRTVEANPDIFEEFRSTNDAITLLSQLRERYEANRGAFEAELADCRARIDDMVERSKLEARELGAEADEIYAGQIQTLEGMLELKATRGVAREVVRRGLDALADEVAAQREETRHKIATARHEIVAKLGAQNLDRVFVPGTLRPAEISSDRQDAPASPIDLNH